MREGFVSRKCLKGCSNKIETLRCSKRGPFLGLAIEEKSILNRN